jgi:hypothetical protein
MGHPRYADDERKPDSGMAAAYRTWRENPNLSPDASIAISLTYSGELAPIEALGFETHGVFGDQALGLVRFEGVPRLVAYDGVLWLSAAQPSRPDLDTAAYEIKARATAPINGPPIDGLWHADVSSGALTNVPKATGKGVIVAIMDTDRLRAPNVPRPGDAEHPHTADLGSGHDTGDCGRMPARAPVGVLGHLPVRHVDR